MSKILVVDDNESVIKLAEFTLENAGYTVDSALSGADALEKLSLNVYDLVITDIIMPDLDGIELINAIRKDYASTKTIAISAGGRMSAEQHLLLAKMMGVNGTIEKPFSKENLLETVSNILS